MGLLSRKRPPLRFDSRLFLALSAPPRVRPLQEEERPPILQLLPHRDSSLAASIQAGRLQLSEICSPQLLTPLHPSFPPPL